MLVLALRTSRVAISLLPFIVFPPFKLCFLPDFTPDATIPTLTRIFYLMNGESVNEA